MESQSPVDRLESEGPSEQGGLRYAKPSEWAAHKELIKTLYLDENKTLDEVRRIMADKHQFRATPSMFKKRIRSWHFLKKLEEDDVLKLFQQKLEREAAGEHAPPPVIRGRVVRNQRLKRFLERRPETLARLQSGASPGTPTTYRWSSPESSGEVPRVLPSWPEARYMEKTLTAIRDYIRACTLGPEPMWEWIPGGYTSRKEAAIDTRLSRLELTRAVDDFYLLQSYIDESKPLDDIFQLLNSTLNRLTNLIRTELPDMFFQMIELLQHTWSNHRQLEQIFRRHVVELAIVQLGREHPLSILWLHMLRARGGESFKIPLNVLYILLRELAISRGSHDQLTSMALAYLLRLSIQTEGTVAATERFKQWIVSFPGWDRSESWSGTIESRLGASRAIESNRPADHTCPSSSAGVIGYLQPDFGPSEVSEAKFCLSYLGGRIALRNGDADRAEAWFLDAMMAAKQHEGYRKIDYCTKVTTNLRVLYTATSQKEKLAGLFREERELEAELPPGMKWPTEVWRM
ncbi:hypothetical protein GGS20DRAFT_527474 [Poronia punctata]|nr:hypothetical protein GGS20DRAFT_527474 [Poronia punctata]